jgi:integrase
MERSAPTTLAVPLTWLLVDDVEDLVFPSSVGTVLDSSRVMSRVLKPAARRAGVPWAGFHTFRHTCATMLFRAGWNAKQVQMQMGHHSPTFTLATYVCTSSMTTSRAPISSTA